MERALYAEIYLVCMLVDALLLFWLTHKDTRSSSEIWLARLLTSFLINFSAEFCFALLGALPLGGRPLVFAAYLCKSCYFVSLYAGVFSWCGYAEASRKSGVFHKKSLSRLLFLLLLIPVILAIVNLWSRWLFSIDAGGAYRRGFLFQAQMGYLFAASCVCSVLLLRASAFEADPGSVAHMRLSATFPLCLLAAWILSFVEEALPVTCVCVLVELMCIFMGTTTQQISMDKLTQVNNRQNLAGFMNYKLANHDGPLFLLMIDVNDFKSINDTWGHISGDDALVRVAASLKRACVPFRKRPYIARYGGDEFIVMLEGTSEEAKALCEGIHARVREADGLVSYRLSVSIGTAEYREGMDSKQFIAAADELMYQAKRSR